MAQQTLSAIDYYKQSPRPKKKKILLAFIGMLLAAALVLLCASYGIIYGVTVAINKPMDYKEAVASGNVASGNKIHFLNTGSSDCIILESNGHLAMIDCAEDTDNPRGFAELELEGYEQRVLKYVKDNFRGADGKVRFDFILGTHSHSDHIGGFDTLLQDQDILVEKAYLKRYHEENIKEQEVVEWDNQEVYDQMVGAVNARGIELIQDIPTESFYLGTFKLRFLNTLEPTEKDLGENENAVALYVEDGDKKILLMADVNYLDGDEQAISKEIGKVDLLKVGHHGYGYSTGTPFLTRTQPKIAILTNDRADSTITVRMRLTLNSRSSQYGTANYNGIIAVIGEEIKLYSNIH
ncbi:MAG: hypothetical protein IJ033_01855 [Clostridia bacterium]|nr:hypothetical protein [Clostridia bacterium]